MEDSKGHRQRVRERYHSGGLDSFQDYEVLELHLSLLLPRIDTKPIARRLLKRFGAIYRVYEASPQELAQVEGIGPKTAFALSVGPALCRRYMLDKWKEKRSLEVRYDLCRYCCDLFIGERYEVSRVILLNAQVRLLHEEVISRGTIDQVTIYARNVTELALRHQAKYVAVAHNHPGGSLRASQGDIDVTRLIMQALEPLDIQLLDHVIVAGNEYESIIELTKEFPNTPFPPSKPAPKRTRKERPPWSGRIGAGPC